MTRRTVVRLLGTAGVAGIVSNGLRLRAAAQSQTAYAVLGSGPTVLAFNREPPGYYEALAQRYRVVVLDYPPRDTSQAFADSFTADRVCSDVLRVADAVGAADFAWYGFSWGAVVGLQLAVRTPRLTALVCGGWPPLGGQYRETLAFAEADAARGGERKWASFYRSLRDWAERDAVSRLTCPRFAFAGTNDRFTAGDQNIRIGPLVAEHRQELENMGWKVQLVEGFGHELGARPDVVTPLLREFLDPILLRAKP
jgi:pimeloyl-ACP methyl ester carboxylesterase